MHCTNCGDKIGGGMGIRRNAKSGKSQTNITINERRFGKGTLNKEYYETHNQWQVKEVLKGVIILLRIAHENTEMQ